MPDENLLSYIKNSEAQGRSEDVTRSMLLSAGWPAQSVDEAFVFLKGSGPQTQHLESAQPSQSQVVQQFQPFQQRTPSSRKGLIWGIVGITILVIILVGGWIVYAYFVNPSPEQVLDAMFQKGITRMTSANNDVQFSLDIHVTPASTTPSSTLTNEVATYASDFLGKTPLEIIMQMESSGTYALATSTINADQDISMSFSTKGTGESITLNGGLEVRLVNGIVYVNLSTIPNFGLFDLTSLEGKWIELPVNTSTEAMAQGLIGQQSLPIPSTTLSPADSQKMLNAIEGIITIKNTLPEESIGGSPSYHYQYVINEPGLENALITITTLTASSTITPSTTAELHSNLQDFFSVFTTIGGEIWIGKNNDYLHQISLTLAFTTSTSYGAINGTINTTSTDTNINGGQVIGAPVGAEDLQTVLQSLFSATSSSPTSAAFGTTQENGRDARRISDVHEIQNGLELYYNKCGYYPGASAPHSQCSSAYTRISTFSALSTTLEGSSLGFVSVPNDPSPDATYYYGTNSAGSKYIIAARLENADNSVFSYYTPPSLAGITISGVFSCKAPMYCLSL